MNRLSIAMVTMVALAAGASSGVRAAAQIEVLHSFCVKTGCIDGRGPTGSLVKDGAGNYYGTTRKGGDADEGTVFKANYNGSRWVVVRIHSFCAEQPNCQDGSAPLGGLVIDTRGNLYGVTNSGGNSTGTAGVAYKLAPHRKTWRYSVIYSFCSLGNCTDGTQPQDETLAYRGQASGTAYDGTSPLYGTASLGGSGTVGQAGVVFGLTPKRQKWTERVLYSFCSRTGCAEGATPESGLSVDGSGNLFGTNSVGGKFGDTSKGGTLYKLSPHGRKWRFHVLHAFCAQVNSGGTCTDGDFPASAPVFDAKGNIFATTFRGGANGDGTVYELSAGGKFSVLHNFCDLDKCADGASPGPGSLAIDSNGNLFGSAEAGGSKAGNGTVFELSGSAHGQFSPLIAFDGRDGWFPVGGLSLDPSGDLFGTTEEGGKPGGGVLFTVKP